MRLQIHKLLGLLILCFCLTDCIGTQPATTQSKDDKEQPAFRELADLLRSEAGVTVKGNSPNYSVTIRGQNTFISSSAPLYVLDGITIGNSYAQAANMINIVDVADIKVLKGSEATSWGSRGANGVIEIRLKKGGGK